MNTIPVKVELKRLLSEVTGQASSAFDDFANDHATGLARMVAQDATEDDLAEWADAQFGELMIRGINVQAAVERAGKTIGSILLAAGRAALGVP